MSKSWKDHSRTAYEGDGDRYPGDYRVAIGCLQRIADACEAMSKNWNALTEDRDWWQRRAKQNDECADRLNRSNAALRGVITRLKKKVKR